jgi:hypothetical protein
MEWLRRGIRSDVFYELLVITWIVASPLAISRWVAGFDDPVTWAAFVAGVLGVLVGYLIVAPYQRTKRERAL